MESVSAETDDDHLNRLRKDTPLPTIIPSAQLEAITRLELAAESLHKALRAVQHPDLTLGGGAIIAPSGLKHLDEIRATLHAIEQTIRPSGPAAPQLQPTTPESEVEPPPPLQELLLSDDESQLVSAVTVGLATDLSASLTRARTLLNQHPSFSTDPEFTSLTLRAALAGCSRLGYRISQFLDAHPDAPGGASAAA